MTKQKTLSALNLAHLSDRIKEVESITQLLPLLAHGEEYKLEFILPVASFKESGDSLTESTWLRSRKVINGAIITATDKGRFDKNNLNVLPIRAV